MEPIATPADLDAYLASGSEGLIAAASALVRRHCGWHVAPSVEETVTVRRAGRLVLLPSLCVTAVSSVTVDGEPVAEHDWCPDGRMWLRPGCEPVTVTMTHGYAAADDVRAVVLAVAARAAASPSGIIRAQVGQINETYTQTAPNQTGGVALLDHEKVALAPYTLPPRP